MSTGPQRMNDTAARVTELADQWIKLSGRRRLAREIIRLEDQIQAVRVLADNLQSWIDEGRGGQSISRQAMRDAILKALDGEQ